MAIMREDHPLLDAPGGKQTAKRGIQGHLVDVLDSSQRPYIQIRLTDQPGDPTGWILDVFVDETANQLMPFDDERRSQFADQCVLQEFEFGVRAHYLMAVAQLRTGITDGDHSQGWGPFSISGDEWDIFGAAPYIDPPIPHDRIRDWISQCSVFAAMALYFQVRIAAIMDRQPTAAELYLTQLIGTKAMAAALKDDGMTIADILELIDADVLRTEGIDPRTVEARGGDALTCGTYGEALAQIALALGDALVETADFITASGQKMATAAQPNSPSEPSAPITFPTQPIPPNLGAPSPGAAGVLPTGGVLGAVIAKGEGDYMSFNRGSAGDAAGKRMNFEAMTLASVLQLQSLPPGNPQRLFAVGKYQCIPSTLNEAVSALKIPAQTMFGRDTQEKIFRQFLVAVKRPAVKSYIVGTSSDLLAAQTALAHEFASVADPATGRTALQGGGNVASIPAGKAALALQAERARYAADRTMTPDQAWWALSFAT